MGVISTVKVAATKTTPVKLGNVQQQTIKAPVKSSPSTVTKSIVSVINPLTVVQPKIVTSGLTVAITPAKIAVAPATTLKAAAAAVADKDKILPALKPPLPKLASSYMIPQDKLTFTKVPTDSIKQSTKKYTAYESLTGISQDRPEIIMMSSFQPIYKQANDASNMIDLGDDDGFLTSAGRFLEAQVQLRYLRAQNVFKVLNNVKKNEKARNEFKERSAKFNDTIGDVYNSANFLLGVIRRLESVKSQLDLRNDIHVVKPDELDALYINNYVGNANNIANLAKYQLQSSISSKFDINDIMSRLGFEKTNLLTYYASTKIWLQLMYEFKQICIAHSLQMIDANTSLYKNDKSPAVLVKPTTSRFMINPSVEIFDIATLTEIQPEQVNVAVNSIDKMYRSLYVSSQLKTPDVKIAALTWTLSREFRFSNGLQQTTTVDALTNYYKYTVNPSGNQAALDYFIGRFGNDIGDVPSSVTNSLVDLAQSRPDSNTIVLTFEEKYITGDNGTLTPGSSYYVDSALNVNDAAFETNRLNSLAVKFEDAYKNFSVVSNGMNLFMKSSPTVSGEYAAYLSNPRSLYVDIAQNIVDFNTGKLLKQASNDKLAGLIDAAASPTGQTVKAALFALIMCRMNRSYGTTTISGGGLKLTIPTVSISDNTATTDKIIEDILDALESSTKPSASALLRLVSSLFVFDNTKNPVVESTLKTDLVLTEDMLRAALKSGSYLLNQIQTLMGKILNTFKASAFENDRSKFGGYHDTIVMMAAFDLIINVFARYSNQTIIGKFVQFGKPQYSIDITDVSYATSINEIEGRLNTEMQLTQQCTYAVLNTLKKLSDSLRGTVNYVESPQSIASVAAVAKVLNDEQIVNMLMSQHQLMMLASTVTDLKAQVQSLTSELKAPSSEVTTLSVDGDQDFDYEDETKILDDGVVSPKTKLALQGFLSDPSFSTTKAINKKIVTVGIPIGFSEKLKQQVTISKSLRSSFTDKQNDIINICVYKVDLENPDIVYLPRKYPFELSRFPVRNDNLHPTFKTTMADYVSKFPTRDYTQTFETNGSANDVQYQSPGRDQTQVFSDDSYSFLTADQKSSIIYNHTVSFLLEVYLRLMTGLSVSEHQFNVLESQKLIGETFSLTMLGLQLEDANEKAEQKAKKQATKTSKITSRSKASVFAATAPAPKQQSQKATKNTTVTKSANMKKSSDVAYAAADSQKGSKHITPTVAIAADPVKKVAQPPKPPPVVAVEVEKVRDRSLPLVLQQFATIDEFTRMLTPLADSLSVSRMLLSPKQFDRIFSVIIDPDDFEIDYSKTIETPHGRDAINQLLARGDVQAVTDSDISAQRNSGAVQITTSNRVSQDDRFKFRDRDRTSGDAVFEKYFIVIETLGGEVV